MSRLTEAIKVILWLLLFTFMFGWLMNSRAQAETVPAPEFNKLASTLVGSQVEVECFTPSDYPTYGGFVYEDFSPVIYLNGNYCGALRRYYNPRFLDQHIFLVGQVTLALTHEAMHLKLRSNDEGRVECTAWRNVWQTIKLLTPNVRARKLIYTGASWFHFSKNPHGPYRTEC
jgi:hypothetical protein